MNHVITFYEKHTDEQWTRFDRSARIEKYVLHRAMREYLPPPPATVVDIGGGNGRHAFHLAEGGYEVHLCDVTPGLVADARRRADVMAVAPASLQVADARELPWSDGAADAALLLGPLYSLLDAGDRLRALREASRVVRPGGIVLIQFFTRVGGLRWVLEAAPAVARRFDWQGFLGSGVFTDEHIPDGMRTHYFSTPAEAVEETRTAGWSVVHLQGMDAPAPGTGQMHLAKAPQNIVDQWGEIAYELGGDRENLSAGTHLLLVARRN